jgi:cytoskeleton-associated protein 5
MFDLICPCSVKQEKLKEKKATMTEALTQTLEAIHKAGCITLLDVIDG